MRFLALSEGGASGMMEQKRGECMLLAIDIGNTNISVGLFGADRTLQFLSSIDTDSRKTADQISIDLMNIFSLYHFDLRDVTGAIFSSVVPHINFMMQKALTRLLGKPPMLVGPGVKTGLNIRIDEPASLGADLACTAVGAAEKYPLPAIIVDLGTATKLTVVTGDRSFIGGSILPGVMISLGALSGSASLLPSIGLGAGKVKTIGSNTVDCMLSGAVLGTASMLDGLIERYREELGEVSTVVACGGLSSAIIPYCKTDIILDRDLLLDGLLAIYRRNVPPRQQ